jgi:DNA invertase Pin-like site-specific DNA recombinase
MTIRARLVALAIAIPAALLLGMIVFAAHAWLQEHDARVKAEMQAGEQQKQIDGLKQQQVIAQQALDTKLASLEQQRKQPATAAKIAEESSILIPTLPQPLRVQSVSDDPALPDSPVSQAVVIPVADFKSIRDAQITCQEDSAKLTACLASEGSEQQQLKLTEAQRDAWKTAARGGSLWHRTLGAVKWFAVGAGTGAAAYAVAHHK